MKYILLTSLLTLLCTSISYAQSDAPVPQRKQLPLAAIKDKIIRAEDTATELKQSLNAEKKDLEEIQKQLVRAHDENRSLEQSLAQLEKKQNALQTEKRQLDATLKEKQAELAKLTSAAIRLKQMPPESYMFSETAPFELGLIQASLKHVMPHSFDLARSVRQDMQDAEKIAQDLEQRQQELETQKGQKAAAASKLESLLTLREQAIQDKAEQLEQYQADIETYARQAKTMESLLSKLSVQKPSLKKDAVYRAPQMPSRGKKQLPVNGAIKIGFGDTDQIGAVSEGIKIRAESDYVVAPMGGTIKYVGAFRQYNAMIIIEHKDNYHSIIAGFDSISVRIGQNILAGEPIGRIRHGQADEAVLYYELRHKGRPVNPV